MKTKLLPAIALTFIFLISRNNLKASHIQSAYISYQYLSPNTYIVKVTLKRDCAGISAPAFVAICYSSATTGLMDTINMLPVPSTGNVVPISICALIPPGGVPPVLEFSNGFIQIRLSCRSLHQTGC